MAPAERKTTPGRKKKSDQQYFDVGKLGRKTGLTLRDTGIRDEHGLEPVSGIFSSPSENNGDVTLASEAMDLQEGSAPEVRTMLSSRKTPRFPLPRQSTPRHTNIGSPKRMSSTKPMSRAQVSEVPGEDHDLSMDSQHPPNRRLNFGNTTNSNRKSSLVLETQSPFKPKKVLRRSNGLARQHPFDIPEDDDAGAETLTQRVNGGVEENENVEQSIEGDDLIMIDGGESYSRETEYGPESAGEAPSEPEAGSTMRRKRGRPRKSDQPMHSILAQDAPTSSHADSSSNKLDPKNLRSSEPVEQDEASTSQKTTTMGPPAKRKRISNVLVHGDEGAEIIDPSMIAHGDEFLAEEQHALADTDADAQTQLDGQLETETELGAGKRGRGRPKGRKGKTLTNSTSHRAPPRGSPVRAKESPSKRARGVSVGPISNVNLRATTPFEDAGKQTSRAGRNLIQPLKFWENESRIWRAGEIEGIVRAEHVEIEKRKSSNKRRKGRGAAVRRLDDIDEESEAESIIADEWEAEMGVITGIVAKWSPSKNKKGSEERSEPVEEDLAFAAASILTRDAVVGDFKFAKITTIPFFGAGLVELPPNGFKRAKNSAKMHIVFFVHTGKVMVEVGGTGLEVNQFALSKGGVWIVPRGNNYAITNVSSTTTAKIFFAQGCVADNAK